MTHIEQVIIDVKEGGYTPGIRKSTDHIKVFHLMRPEFWQALGKTREWNKPKRVWSYFDGDTPRTLTQRWRNEMLSCTNHLAEGKDAESFFATLV